MSTPKGKLADPEWRTERARKAVNTRWRKQRDRQAVDAINNAVAKVVEAAPALTDEQIDRLRQLLPPVVDS